MLPNINILAREVARARKPPVMLFLHVHARRGIVVLVYHQSIEAHLFRVLVLVQVPLEQIMGLIRVEIRIGKQKSCGVVLLQVFISDIAVWLLREPINLYVVLGPS